MKLTIEHVGPLGARITAAQVVGRGCVTAGIVVAAVASTIVLGHLLARQLGVWWWPSRRSA